MALRQSCALNLTPLFLRFALAVTFLWAGAGKLFYTMPVEGEQARILAEYGVSLSPSAAPARPPAIDPPPLDPDAAPDAPTELPAETPAIEDLPPAPERDDEPAFIDPELRSSAPYTAVFVQDSTPEFTAEQFTEPVEVARLYGLVLLMDAANVPGFDGETGEPKMKLWPDAIGRGTSWPVALAWAAAITELVAGALLVIGFFTRLSALALAGTMLTAAWLTVVGPAMQTGDAFMGFLPNIPLTETDAWKTPLWQLALFCTSMGLFFSGPGGLSLDAALFGRSRGVPTGAKAPAKPRDDED